MFKIEYEDAAGKKQIPWQTSACRGRTRGASWLPSAANKDPRYLKMKTLASCLPSQETFCPLCYPALEHLLFWYEPAGALMYPDPEGAFAWLVAELTPGPWPVMFVQAVCLEVFIDRLGGHVPARLP